MQFDWQEGYFNKDYLYLYESRLNTERTRTEVDFIKENVFTSDTKTILDIPCGYGRHAMLLAEQGYAVHGIDASAVMIAEAEKRRATLQSEAQDRLTYEQADMRTYVAPQSFDVALNLFSSFGYFSDSVSNEAVMHSLCSNVRKGGIIVIDVRNPMRDIIEFSKNDWRQVDVEDTVRIEQSLDPITLRHTLTYFYEKDGKPKEKSGSWQHFLLPEFDAMLGRMDCTVECTYGNFRGQPYGPDTSRLIVVARRMEK